MDFLKQATEAAAATAASAAGAAVAAKAVAMRKAAELDEEFGLNVLGSQRIPFVQPPRTSSPPVSERASLYMQDENAGITRYRCMNKAAVTMQLEPGPGLAPEVVRVLEKGDLVTVSASQKNSAGQRRLHIGSGWVSEVSTNGTVLLTPLEPEFAEASWPVFVEQLPAESAVSVYAHALRQLRELGWADAVWGTTCLPLGIGLTEFDELRKELASGRATLAAAPPSALGTAAEAVVGRPYFTEGGLTVVRLAGSELLLAGRALVTLEPAVVAAAAAAAEDDPVDVAQISARPEGVGLGLSVSDGEDGPLVSALHPTAAGMPGAAERAGLAVGCRLVSVDGTAVADQGAVRAAVAAAEEARGKGTALEIQHRHPAGWHPMQPVWAEVEGYLGAVGGSDAPAAVKAAVGTMVQRPTDASGPDDAEWRVVMLARLERSEERAALGLLRRGPSVIMPPSFSFVWRIPIIAISTGNE
jgi:hypothetical protein